MLNNLLKLRNDKQPKSLDNIDTLQFDYKFWTELEKLSKKQRTTSLETLLSACPDATKPGVILRSKQFITIFKESAPVKAFDKEAFIEEIIKRVPKISRHVLREAATAAVVEGSTRKTYTVEENDD